ncbi:uncharacterized protein MONBRDRAFT_10360 [Monosiga brevicollis MX1]|uniref:Uncharacterized protein n=1 Tax=Monosiga brevicollis TaxID=81824 RepID=A9V5Z8_MONBE|nr:uncharacterized protein MONBRDRAFT_10360 [Monosiga brevicollis MX1]EDQ86900.1 predicted protein [Monosiga brevicollis MX1]|eukprot:XP_001748139.1 hypothetical protein [Monosiga brevicollis MX1]
MAAAVQAMKGVMGSFRRSVMTPAGSWMRSPLASNLGVASRRCFSSTRQTWARQPSLRPAPGKGPASSSTKPARSGSTSHAAKPSAAAAGGAATHSSAGDVLVFSCERTGFIRLMKAAAFSQVTLWISAATLAPQMREEGALDGKASSSTRFGWTFASLMMAVMFLGLGIYVPRRYVSRLYTTGQGQLRIQTYNYWGRRSFEMPVSELLMTTRQTTAVANSVVTFRIPGHRFFYMLDGTNGTLHNQSAYNLIVRQARQF